MQTKVCVFIKNLVDLDNSEYSHGYRAAVKVSPEKDGHQSGRLAFIFPGQFCRVSGLRTWIRDGNLPVCSGVSSTSKLPMRYSNGAWGWGDGREGSCCRGDLKYKAKNISNFLLSTVR